MLLLHLQVELSHDAQSCRWTIPCALVGWLPFIQMGAIVPHLNVLGGDSRTYQ